MTPRQKTVADTALYAVRGALDWARTVDITGFTRTQVVAGMNEIVKGVGVGRRIKFKASTRRPGAGAIMPGNLYTALLVAGVRVHPSEVAEAAGEYTDSHGVRYAWHPKYEQLYVWPPAIRQALDMTFVVGSDYGYEEQG